MVSGESVNTAWWRLVANSSSCPWVALSRWRAPSRATSRNGWRRTSGANSVGDQPGRAVRAVAIVRLAPPSPATRVTATVTGTGTAGGASDTASATVTAS